MGCSRRCFASLRNAAEPERSDDRRRSSERPRVWSLVLGPPEAFRTRGSSGPACGPPTSRGAVGQSGGVDFHVVTM